MPTTQKPATPIRDGLRTTFLTFAPGVALSLVVIALHGLLASTAGGCL